MLERPENQRYLFWLAVGTVIIAMVVAVMLALQLTQKGAIEQNSKQQVDSITSLTFQFEREFLRFRQTLDSTVNNRTPPNLEALNLRFDIFVSRLNLLRANPSTIDLLQRPEYVDILPRLDQLIQYTDMVLLKAATEPKSVARLLDDFNAIGPDVQALSSASNSLLARLVEDQKTRLLRQNDHIIWLTFAQLILLLAASAALVVRHRRQEQEMLALQNLTRDLRQAHLQTASANRSKSQFIANMSHELRTPFNGMLGMLSLLEGTPLSPHQSDCIKTVHASANQLFSLLNDILDIVALDTDKVTIQTSPTSLTALIGDVETVMVPMAADKRLVFSVTLAEDLPAWCGLDNIRVKQILFNLTNNAIKFTDTGQVTLGVRHAMGPQDIHFLEFRIEDTGIGISEHAIPRLFNRFYQVDSGLTRSFGGTGLGLEISQSLAKLMNGFIHVTSTPGQGSIFTLHLPLTLCETPVVPPPPVTQIARTSDAVSKDAERSAAPHATKKAPLALIRVLVVEDHPVNSKFVGVLLSRMGFEATFCENGQLAVDIVQQETFDLILMDVNMPVMDGLTATRAIRALPGAMASVPIIVLTADIMNEARANALAAGATDFLTKPVQIAQFRTVLQSYLIQPAAH